ncbi:hypothetical protein E4U24_000148 [Claviceps purpurea]|nr:hypothetical protein E4U36_008303 [Claviceps purpurea]KAG6234774.1 hypothetical protein E4U24_000148 [Claviceps purpurea]
MAHSRTRAPQPMVTIKQHWGKQFRDDEDEDDEEGNRYGQTVDGEDNMLGRTGHDASQKGPDGAQPDEGPPVDGADQTVHCRQQLEDDETKTNRKAPEIRKLASAQK